MTRLTIIALVLIVLLTASCSPGGAPASTVVTEKQQVTTFLKAAAPIEKDVATVDADMVTFSQTMAQLTKEVRATRMTDFASRIKTIRAKAAAIQKPAVPDAGTFYDKWLKSITTFELYITSMDKGDFDSAEKAMGTLSSDYAASDAALASLLSKYGITKAEVSWPT